MSRAAICFFLAFILGSASSEAQDFRRGRVSPNEQSKRAGSAIAWQTDFDAAMQIAKEKNKPIFWYVPTVPNTFMDRKLEIDRYMKAGPFSWPAIINLVNDRFVPLMLVPNANLAKKYELVPYQFVEPGIIVVDRDGNKTQMVDHLTTLHPHWFYSLVAGWIKEEKTWSQSSSQSDRTAIDALWKAAISSRFRDLPENWNQAFEQTEFAIEADWISGMVAFRKGKQVEAKSIWKTLSETYPDHPLAWKAANEAQGIGPFVRGFEVFGEVPSKGLQAGIDSPGSAAPQGTYDERAIWERSTEFLVDMQDETGGYFDSDYDFGGIDSMPNIHTAVTSLVGLALIESRETCQSPELKEQASRALAKALDYVADPSHLNTADRDEILWAQAYRLQLLASAVGRLKMSDRREALQQAVDGLQKIQLKNGSWYHEYTNAFVTGTALVALKDAEKAGATVDMEKVKLGLERLEKQRYPNGAYPYDERRDRGAPRNEPIQGSVGRICICQLARHCWKAIDDQQLTEDVKISLEYHPYLAKGFKYDNHTSTYAYGGFFFWYDMHARSEAIAAIGVKEWSAPLAKQHRELILALPELDGCFVDSHELGRTYGTAMALLALNRLATP